MTFTPAADCPQHIIDAAAANQALIDAISVGTVAERLAAAKTAYATLGQLDRPMYQVVVSAIVAAMPAPVAQTDKQAAYAADRRAKLIADRMTEMAAKIADPTKAKQLAVLAIIIDATQALDARTILDKGAEAIRTGLIARRADLMAAIA